MASLNSLDVGLPFISLVPFVALFNDEEKKFMIEEKAVGIIPSIRTLHQCLQQQSEFEIVMRSRN